MEAAMGPVVLELIWMLVVLLGRVIRLNDRPVQAIPEAAAIITSNSTNKHRPKRKHKHKKQRQSRLALR